MLLTALNNQFLAQNPYSTPFFAAKSQIPQLSFTTKTSLIPILKPFSKNTSVLWIIPGIMSGGACAGSGGGRRTRGSTHRFKKIKIGKIVLHFSPLPLPKFQDSCMLAKRGKAINLYRSLMHNMMGLVKIPEARPKPEFVE